MFAPGGGYLVELPTIRVDYGFVCLLVCLLRIFGIFTEWYLRRPHTKKPIVFLKRRSKQGPADLTFKEQWIDFQGKVEY